MSSYKFCFGYFIIGFPEEDAAYRKNYLREIKKLKPVEPYKGKGIREKDQYVIRKECKKK